MATKDIKRLEDCIRVLDTRIKEVDRAVVRVEQAGSDAKRTAAENKAWLSGNLDINTGAISKLNGDLYLYSQRISSLEEEVGRLKSSRFSFKTYLSRLFNALRNKP